MPEDKLKAILDTLASLKEVGNYLLLDKELDVDHASTIIFDRCNDIEEILNEQC